MTSAVDCLKALEIEMYDDDGETVTVRQWLWSLLSTLWREGENFNGKRPFGNSGWQFQVYQALIKNEIIAGELDEDGFVKSIADDEAAEEFVDNLIYFVFFGEPFVA